MTAEQKVKQAFPSAYAYEEAQPNSWTIYTLQGACLGTGTSEKKAWVDALNKISQL